MVAVTSICNERDRGRNQCIMLISVTKTPTSSGIGTWSNGSPVRAFGQMRHEHQPWLCAVEHMVSLKLLHSRQHCPLACACHAASDAMSQDQWYLRHRDFCKRILPAIPPIIDVETMNEFDARCHHLFRVAQAVDNHRCIACGHDRPVLEPLAIASSLSIICPSCDEALQQELRNAYSRENQTHSFSQCVTLTALGIRVLHMFLWWNLIAKKRPSEWAPGNSRLIFKVRCLDKDDLLLHR